MDEELREHIDATRRVVRSALNALRTANQFLADLDERLERAENAQPEEAQRNGHRSHETSAARTR